MDTESTSMKIPSLPASRLAALGAAWQARPLRERRLILVATIVLTAALIGSAVDRLAESNRQLARQIPQLASQLAEMEEQAAELPRLRALPPASRPSGPALAEALTAAARRHGLTLSTQASAGDGFEIAGSGGFDALIDWLAGAQRDHGLHPASLDVTREAGAVRFSVRLTAGNP